MSTDCEAQRYFLETQMYYQFQADFFIPERFGSIFI